MLPASARMGNVCASGLNSDKFDDLTCERRGNLAGARADRPRRIRRQASGTPIAPSWISQDGVEWIPGGVVSAVEADCVGAAVAFDDASNSFRVVLADRTSKSVELSVAAAPGCATWSAPEPVASLPDDSEAPSYLVPGFAARHEVTFTRPPSGSSGRTIWRARSEDGLHLTLDEAPVAEIPDEAHVAAPFAISRIGTDDAVAVYPIHPSAGVSGRRHPCPVTHLERSGTRSRAACASRHRPSDHDSCLNGANAASESCPQLPTRLHRRHPCSEQGSGSPLA
jgi:hypothetical protein